MHSRLTIVTRNAFGDRMSPRGACCQRMNASCSTSSASATVPTMRYAIENRRLRCSLKVVNGLGAAAAACCGLVIWLLRGRLVSGYGGRFERMTLLEVVVRDRQQAEENERIDDVQHAEIACVAA